MLASAQGQQSSPVPAPAHAVYQPQPTAPPTGPAQAAAPVQQLLSMLVYFAFHCSYPIGLTGNTEVYHFLDPSC